LVLVILAVVWAAVLIPPAVRARAESRPSDSILAFHRQLGTLRRTGPRREGVAEATVAASLASLARRPARPTYAPPRQQAAPHVSPHRPLGPTARRRRRDVLVALATAAAASLTLGFLPTLRWMLAVHAVTLALLGAYVTLLVQHRNRRVEQAQKVHYLTGARRRRWAEDAWLEGESAWLAN